MSLGKLKLDSMPRSEVPESVIAKEKEIYAEQLKGKPVEMMENILKGKIEKFYEEVCLVDQFYIKDDTKKIHQLLSEKTGETGEKITIRRFARFELGEGIEKKSVNFADEVAEQIR